MSGHSKWATTKRQKFILDAKRGSAFTKLSRNITIAAKSGIDPSANFKLRMAVDAARSASMPKDNIERAINKAKDSSDSILSEVMYEGFGPFGIFVLVEALADNKNRTLGEIKNVFLRHGCALGGQNSVVWNFNHVGMIKIKDKISAELELKIVEAGADDFHEFEDYIFIYTAPQNLQTVQNNLIKVGLSPEESSLEFVPKEAVSFTNEEEKNTINKFLDELDDLADVKQCYTNVEC